MYNDKHRKIGRRAIIKAGALFSSLWWLGCDGVSAGEKNFLAKPSDSSVTHNPFLPPSQIYCSRNNTADNNMLQVLEMLGGIEALIEPNDIVVLKPNAQWWSQGTTNTNAMKTFIDKVISRKGFTGEIIIAENLQYDNPNSRGWTTEHRNGKFNLNELIDYFQGRGHRNVTKYHWRPVTPNKPKRKTQNPENFSQIVEGPWQGEGYVYDEKLYYESPLGRRCLLSYPIFESGYSGTLIDLKNGAFRNNEYSGQPVKLINFSAMNHHGFYAGATASVKNYMGVVDMSCGTPRGGPKGYYNLHHIGVQELPGLYDAIVPWRVRQELKRFVDPYRYRFFHHTGAALGSFMKQVRMADLNIITAHWVGFGSRTDESLSAYPKAIVAGKDPVALDFWSGREILKPLTLSSGHGEAFAELNDPDNMDKPFGKFLMACHLQGIGNYEKEKIISEVNS